MKYRNYLLNSSLLNQASNGHASWNRQGPFHGFPLLPADIKCLLGQLTFKGISQLLHIGEIMKQAYAGPLDLFKKPLPIPAPKINSSTESQAAAILNSDEIVVFSTRYRR